MTLNGRNVTRKRVCDFLLLCRSKFGPILYRFRDIADFFVLMTHPVFQPNFRDVPVAHRSPMFSPNRSLKLIKLISREIIFEVFQPVWIPYLKVTDGRTDTQTTHCGITAVCVASRGKTGKTGAAARPAVNDREKLLLTPLIDEHEAYVAHFLKFRLTVAATMTSPGWVWGDLRPSS